MGRALVDEYSEFTGEGGRLSGGDGWPDVIVEVAEMATGIVALAGDAVVIVVVDGSVPKSTSRVVTVMALKVGTN